MNVILFFSFCCLISPIVKNHMAESKGFNFQWWMVGKSNLFELQTVPTQYNALWCCREVLHGLVIKETFIYESQGPTKLTWGTRHAKLTVISGYRVTISSGLRQVLAVVLCFSYLQTALLLWLHTRVQRTVSPSTLQSSTKKLDICISCITGTSFQQHTLSKGAFALS